MSTTANYEIKHVKLLAHGPHASFLWPVSALEFDMLGVPDRGRLRE